MSNIPGGLLPRQIDAALAVAGLKSPGYRVGGPNGALSSWFDVTGLASTAIGAACAEVQGLHAADNGGERVLVDRKLASLWFDLSIRPQGWLLPPVWDSIAGLYQTKDGWVRLHTNAPHHRTAALAVLRCVGEPAAVAAAIGRWPGTALESAIVEAGGCCAELRSIAAWQQHPQGAAVAQEPLIAWSGAEVRGARSGIPGASLAGIRVLDLTRVLAGPICTRFLAAFGAEILRIDPPGWAEPNVVAEVSVGKRCATLDLRAPADRERLQQLIADADLMVHGLRPGALDALGFSASERRRLNPRLIDVSLCAYGWTGPWAERRGYDSLVQMSCGIADAGMRLSNADKPTPLPVQALDHATGYLMAAAALRALRVRNHDGRSLTARLSLARTAALLIETQTERLPQALPTERSADVVNDIEATDWGPAQRLRFPATVPGVTPRWLSPAREFHSAPASWR